MEKVAIVDYGMSNLHSVFSALTKVSNGNFDIQISRDPSVINDCDRVVFPGQGAAADCMRQINHYGLADSIQKAASEKPFLGICMGMQVLLENSQENNNTECLGLLKGSVKAFSEAFKTTGVGNEHKIPHMGWNTIEQKFDHPIWAGIEQHSYFYFVHSYYVSLADARQSAGMTDYGIEFSSVLANGKVFAMQCHPEKSADNGLQLLTNFLNWNGN
ncbi:MAG: imidazole glycerol phosphate synthase subunit HisH [Gammaproteobacteria bacterium]